MNPSATIRTSGVKRLIAVAATLGIIVGITGVTAPAASAVDATEPISTVNGSNIRMPRSGGLVLVDKNVYMLGPDGSLTKVQQSTPSAIVDANLGSFSQNGKYFVTGNYKSFTTFEVSSAGQFAIRTDTTVANFGGSLTGASKVVPGAYGVDDKLLGIWSTNGMSIGSYYNYPSQTLQVIKISNTGAITKFVGDSHTSKEGVGWQTSNQEQSSDGKTIVAERCTTTLNCPIFVIHVNDNDTTTRLGYLADLLDSGNISLAEKYSHAYYSSARAMSPSTPIMAKQVECGTGVCVDVVRFGQDSNPEMLGQYLVPDMPLSEYGAKPLFFSKDGARLFIPGAEGQNSVVFDVGNDGQLSTPRQITVPGLINISNDGNYLFAQSNGQVSTYLASQVIVGGEQNPGSGAGTSPAVDPGVSVPATPGALAPVFSPDHSRVAILDSPSSTTVWLVAPDGSWTDPVQVPLPDGQTSIAWSADSTTFVTAKSADTVVNVYCACGSDGGYLPAQPIEVGEPVYSVTSYPGMGGGIAAVTDSGVSTWTQGSAGAFAGRVDVPISGTGPSSAAHYVASTGMLALPLAGGIATFEPGPAPEPVFSPVTCADPAGAVFSADGSTFAVYDSTSGKVIVCGGPDYSQKTEIDIPGTSAAGADISLSSDGRNIAIVNAIDGATSIVLLDETGNITGTVDMPADPGAQCTFMDETNFACVGGDSGTGGTFRLLLAGGGTTGTAGQGTATVIVDPTLQLSMLDDLVSLTGLPELPTTVSDNRMAYSITTNNMLGYAVLIKADQAALTGTTPGNTDVIPVSAITASQDGAGALSADTPVQLHSQDTRSIEAGDQFTTEFSADIPFVNADTYTGTVTLTATAK